jgi:hypothetical protein
MYNSCIYFTIKYLPVNYLIFNLITVELRLALSFRSLVVVRSTNWGCASGDEAQRRQPPQHGQKKPQEQKQQYKLRNQNSLPPALVVVQPRMGIGSARGEQCGEQWRP